MPNRLSCITCIRSDRSDGVALFGFDHSHCGIDLWSSLNDMFHSVLTTS